MNEIFDTYEILVDNLNLPDTTLQQNLEICTPLNSSEFNKTLNLFLEIFPDEIDHEKEMNLRDFRGATYEGMFIATLEEKVIGFLITGISNDVGYILYIGVLKEFRSKGIATNLFKRFQYYLKEKNIQRVYCKIRGDNKKTLGYIKYLGFKKVKK